LLSAGDLTIMQVDVPQRHVFYLKSSEGDIPELTINEFAALNLHVSKHDLSHSTPATFKSDTAESGSGNAETFQIDQVHAQIADRGGDDRGILEEAGIASKLRYFTFFNDFKSANGTGIKMPPVNHAVLHG